MHSWTLNILTVSLKYETHFLYFKGQRGITNRKPRKRGGNQTWELATNKFVFLSPETEQKQLNQSRLYGSHCKPS